MEKIKVEVIAVTTGRQIGVLAALADKVWHEYFVRLLSPRQIDYMVEKFQSEGALTGQLSQGYEYYFLRTNGKDVGYIGIKPTDGKLLLSKLYILAGFRGQGISSAAFDFMEGLCRERGLASIWLTVNRYNEHSIAVYRHRGFSVTEEKVTDIGQGFVMDDFIMEKTLVQG